MHHVLPYVNNQYNAVFIAFGLKQKPLGGVELIQTAAFNYNGRWKGWNWTWSMLRSNQVWYERLIYITDANNQFCFEWRLAAFRFVAQGGKMRKKLITDRCVAPC